VDIDSPRAREGVAAVAAVLSGRLAAIAAEVQALIEREVPALRDDQRVVAMLQASVVENITTVVHVLRHDIDVTEIGAPTSAIEYARRLAQRDIDAAALVRAYRLGQARFIRLFMEQLRDQTGSDDVDGATAMRAVEQVSDYIDQIVGALLPVYEQERAGWLQHRRAVLAGQVRMILDGERVDVDRLQTLIGYRLRQKHLGLVLWFDGDPVELDVLRALTELVAASASVAGSTDGPLFVPCDDTTAWAWLPLEPDQTLGAAELAALMAKAPESISIALGESASGVDGFRRTHRQAVSAQRVAVAAGSGRARVTPFAEVAPIALMCADLDGLSAWVAETLGPLATLSERNDGLRETARVFLTTGGSYAATADQLFLHRNTVQYRIRQAEQLRGRPLAEGRLALEVALLAWHWLGSSVLRPA
jgi:DNA-binding PucR family transcriptional regulator